MKFEGKLRDEFKAAIRFWADSNPQKDDPIFGFSGEKLYTPVEIADHVENETEFGKEVIDMIEKGATDARHSAEDVIARFRRPQT